MFEKSTNVQFQCKKEVANLDATILGVDPVLAVVGGCSKDEDEAQPTRPKRKLFQCSYCVRRRSWYSTSTVSILLNNISFVCLDDDHDGAFRNKHFKTLGPMPPSGRRT